MENKQKKVNLWIFNLTVKDFRGKTEHYRSTRTLDNPWPNGLCFRNISLSKQRNRMNMGCRKSSGSGGNFLVASLLTLFVGSWQEVSKIPPPQLTYHFAESGRTKGAVAHDKNYSPLTCQLLTNPWQSYITNRHLSHTPGLPSQPSIIKRFHISALIPKQPIATYLADLAVNQSAQSQKGGRRDGRDMFLPSLPMGFWEGAVVLKWPQCSKISFL